MIQCLTSHLVFIPSCVSGRGHGTGPVCVCAHVSVSALLAEPFHIRTRNLVDGLTLTISRMRLKVKRKGQGR